MAQRVLKHVQSVLKLATSALPATEKSNKGLPYASYVCKYPYECPKVLKCVAKTVESQNVFYLVFVCVCVYR